LLAEGRFHFPTVAPLFQNRREGEQMTVFTPPAGGVPADVPAIPGDQGRPRNPPEPAVPALPRIPGT
jgi:hypothetical protein